MRDPREHNHVTGAHRSAGTAAREEQELSSERWVADFPTLVPVHQISPGKLYLIQLTEPEAGYKLGFAEAGEAVNDTDHKALWFVKQGSATAWGDSPSFIPYEIEGARQSDPIVHRHRGRQQQAHQNVKLSGSSDSRALVIVNR